MKPEPRFSIEPARYARGMMAVHCQSDGTGFKTRAMRLIGDHLNGRFSGREGAYIVSPAKVRKLEALFASGFDANFISGELIPPEDRL